MLRSDLGEITQRRFSRRVVSPNLQGELDAPRNQRGPLNHSLDLREELPASQSCMGLTHTVRWQLVKLF